MQKVKDKEIRRWYMLKCLEEGWSDSILIYPIDANLYNRQEKAIKHNNFEKLKNVFLELGSGFSFVGNQYKINIKSFLKKINTNEKVFEKNFKTLYN